MADTGEVAGLAPRGRCLGNRISSSLLGCELDDPALFWARCLEVMEIQQEEHMVERAMGVNLKELEGKHSREMLRRRTGRILEKGWQEYKLHSVNKRSRGS